MVSGETKRAGALASGALALGCILLYVVLASFWAQVRPNAAANGFEGLGWAILLALVYFGLGVVGGLFLARCVWLHWRAGRTWGTMTKDEWRYHREALLEHARQGLQEPSSTLGDTILEEEQRARAKTLSLQKLFLAPMLLAWGALLAHVSAWTFLNTQHIAAEWVTVALLSAYVAMHAFVARKLGGGLDKEERQSR